MIRDRGNIKWTAMMLPEHVQMVREVYQNQNKIPKPKLDEQAWEEIGLTVQDAVENNKQLAFTYWQNGYFETLVGHVHLVDINRKQFRIVDQFQERYHLKFENLVDVREV
ncbi:hypothetical protein BKP45_05130 [Anaerobacillus alkalidiazotrophicus]|uniref:YolD-like family protein n=1 Tax=Anaerobacillus alkalidiazotrophicus TaxID=472963 RepID=A0A1S2MBI4_9BACI|nr:YolD-like family protein [Anaerobacillus alkalidiazotrophicus]OIJ22061.1 hypothetical protein BKP45_05130 [Anaerobacillus alkalidiazotrophicus]